MSTMIDPMEMAVTEAERPNYLYGQLETSAEFVMFAGGKKVAWSEGIDDPKDRKVEVALIINPIEESGLTNLSTRNVICENWNEWGKIVWPSLRDDCGIANLREADKKWFKVESVKTGRSYISKKTGERVENTTFKFVGVFDTKEECVADYLADGNIDNKSKVAEPALNDGGHTMADAAMEVDMTSEKETAKNFLPALVKMSQGNMDMLKQHIQNTPMIAKFFTIDSPEVQELLKAA